MWHVNVLRRPTLTHGAYLLSILNFKLHRLKSFHAEYRYQTNLSCIDTAQQRRSQEFATEGGGKRGGLGDGSFPAGSMHRQSPGEGVGAKPKKPETHAEYSTEQNT